MTGVIVPIIDERDIQSYSLLATGYISGTAKSPASEAHQVNSNIMMIFALWRHFQSTFASCD
jgi:hypothetical protein